LIPQKKNFLNIQVLLLLEIAAYKKKYFVISFCYYLKYISTIKKTKEKREKQKKKFRSKRRLLDSATEN